MLLREEAERYTKIFLSLLQLKNGELKGASRFAEIIQLVGFFSAGFYKDKIDRFIRKKKRNSMPNERIRRIKSVDLSL